MACAAAMSSSDTPVPLNTVTSASLVRPATRLLARSARSASTCSFPTAPSSTGMMRSPASLHAASHSSQNTRALRMTSVSSSRVWGWNAPMAFTCVPAFSHSPRTTGSVALVTVQMMSAASHAACRLAQYSMENRASAHSPNCSSTNFWPFSGERHHTMNFLMSLTACMAAMCVCASLPAPTIVHTKSLVSRQRSWVASPLVEAVRMAVTSEASMIARTAPLAASKTSTQPCTTA
mmetsp:Transcript_957/g.2293  ORF Transcript_957/g.2293 Transcript_957/m.2293 type:complete len:235 (-) Transcript_957:337-1041(-)